MPLVSNNVASQAAYNVADYFGYDAQGGHINFWNFIGLPYDPYAQLLRQDACWDLPERIARRVEAIAGPHHKAFIKVLIISGHTIVSKQPS
jgi:hypothetical protein